jgi:ATP-dependent helicase HrpA
MSLHFLSIGTQRELLDDLLGAAIDRACFNDRPVPRDPEVFREALSRGRARLAEVTDRVAARVFEILAAHHRIQQRLQGEQPASRQEAVEDIHEQLAGLVYSGFISATPPAWLDHLPRYLRAIELRLDKLDQAPDKDRQRRALVEPLWRSWRQRFAADAERGREDPELDRFRWLIEELRVSQFAQELRTVQPVSVKRLEQRWRELTAA